MILTTVSKNRSVSTRLYQNDSEDKHAQPKVIKLFDKNVPSKNSETPTVAPKPTTPPPKAEKRLELTKSEAQKPKKSKIQATILPGMLEGNASRYASR